jgi:SAM-dependent methyltransferase
VEERVQIARGEEAARLVEEVRERYGRIARGLEGGCCGPSTSCATAETETGRLIGYSEEDLARAPKEANLGLGCGAPLGHLALKAGETVLDLGSGAGLDAFIAAPQVGPSGRVIGVDMTPEMLDRARRNAEKMGLPQVEFREGRLEALPVEDGSIDAVTSNCVINLVPDKGAVFAEIARVLRPGGRLVVSDIILDGPLPTVVEKDLYSYVGCIGGAMMRDTYFGLLKKAGLSDVDVLRDVDFLSTVVQEQLQEIVDRLGVDRADLTGRVRSLTYRAIRPGNSLRRA